MKLLLPLHTAGRAWPLGLLLAALSLSPGCKKHPPAGSNPAATYFLVEPVQLKIPRLPGWLQDPAVGAEPAAGAPGTTLRLVRQSAVAGSPRLDVVLTAVTEQPMSVETFLTRNLQQMAQLERSGQIHITNVEQSRVTLGSLPAYRVRHEYAVGTGAGQASINQVSTFFVLQGRGVAVTAAGRTELFHPLAHDVETMMQGLRLADMPGPAPAVQPPPAAGPQAAGPADEGPVNLGKIGGRRKPGQKL
jgi:hypothetical protein